MNRHFRVASRLPLKLEELGVPVATVLRRAGLPQDLFDQPRVLVTTPELFALWRAIGETAPEPGLGLQLAAESRTERLHPASIAALATEDFGAAIRHLARYKQLTAPEEILHETADGAWRIYFRWLLAVDAEPAVLTEYCFAALLNLGRHGSGTRLTPLRVELMQPRAHVKAIERHFGCQVVTGAARNTLVFRAEDERLPFITRNAELLEMLAPQLDAELAKSTGTTDTFTELVRSAIQQRLAGHRPTMDAVARALHMSGRTLQRRLQESGTSFQAVLDEARHQMARYYLGNSVLELNEAAYLLGYEDANSFVRAFRTWEGMPPGTWRETHRARAIQ